MHLTDGQLAGALFAFAVIWIVLMPMPGLGT